MDEQQLDLGGEAEDEAVLSIYRQVAAVLGRDAGSVINDPETVELVDTLFATFAEAGVDGLTYEQARHACRRFPDKLFEHRFDVLRRLRAVQPLFPKPNAQRFRASFTTYVSLLFLRRMMARGGQSELHQLLAMEQLNLRSEAASEDDARAAAGRLTQVFRLIASELFSLVNADDDERLREQAVLLWDANTLKFKADEAHRTILDRWPELMRPRADLRGAIREYGDATQAACARLQSAAGTTRTLGMLPSHVWTNFVKHATVDQLSDVLTSFVFDAPAPWVEPGQIRDALSQLSRSSVERAAPPRDSTPAEPPRDNTDEHVERAQHELRDAAERVLGDHDHIAVAELLRDCGDWSTARRVLADMTAAANDVDLPYVLDWDDVLDTSTTLAPSWVTRGWFRRTLTTMPESTHG